MSYIVRTTYTMTHSSAEHVMVPGGVAMVHALVNRVYDHLPTMSNLGMRIAI